MRVRPHHSASIFPSVCTPRFRQGAGLHVQPRPYGGFYEQSGRNQNLYGVPRRIQ
jgi:hypothetical protein